MRRGCCSDARIVIPGGSGQVGAMLAHGTFMGEGHDVTVLSRKLTSQRRDLTSDM